MSARTYPKVGTVVVVTYVGTVDPAITYEYAGTVYADRYPEYALNVGDSDPLDQRPGCDPSLTRAR